VEMPIDAPPRGFKVAAADDGSLMIRYRTTGMGKLAVVLMVWLTIWSIGCGLITCTAIFPPINFIFLLLMGPMWVVELVTIRWVFWFFFSVTRFLFGEEELVVERQLLWHRRRRVFRRSEVTAVRQVKDDGERRDSFYGWALVVMTGPGVELLSNQPIDKSDWFGPVVAKWAGVSFEPATPTTEQKYEEI
jgi:hypothetical protein